MSKSKDTDMGVPVAADRAAIDTWSRSGKRATIEVRGGSMGPLLRHGSVVVVEPVRGSVRSGDMVVFFQGDTLTVHRIVRVLQRDGECRFRTKGDGAFNLDPVVLGERDLAGRVVGLVAGDRVKDLETGLHRGGGRIVAALSYCVGKTVGVIKYFFKLFHPGA
jgi:signal peptidase I